MLNLFKKHFSSLEKKVFESMKKITPMTNIIHKYEEVIELLPKTIGGNIVFNKQILNKAIKSAKTKEDFSTLLNIIADFIGNKCIPECSEYDKIIKRAYKNDCFESIFPILENNRPLMYYPDSKLLENIMKGLIEKKEKELMFSFFDVINKN
jgi:hypothetical protein